MCRRCSGSSHNLRGEQIYVTEYAGKSSAAFSAVARACRGHGHLAIGVRCGEQTRLNLSPERMVAPGDSVISIGPSRLPSLSDP